MGGGRRKGQGEKRVFGHYTYMKRLDTGDVIPALVEVHVVDVQRTKKKFPEAHERRLTWVTPLDASRMVGEPELQGLFRKLGSRAVR